MANRLINKRKQIDPKTLRKHSQIVAKTTDPLLVVGDRHQTDFGVVIEGYNGKSFETFYMAIMPNCMTPTWKHEKKTRIYRVAGGSGNYQTPTELRPLSTGDEIVVPAGTVHSIMSSTVKLEMYVTQDAKYAASLEEVAPASKIAEVSVDDLRALTAEDVNGARTGRRADRRGSKAREQIAASRGDTIAQAGMAQRSANADTFFRNDTAGINVRPVMNFSEEGAG